MKRYKPYAILIAVLVALDQASKAWIEAKVGLYGSVRVIPGFFSLSHVRNTGGIFGIFNGTPSLWIRLSLLGLSLTALVLVLVYFFKAGEGHGLLKYSLALVVAGALGNQIDRIARGYVVDFLEMHVRRFYWPTFNVADSCVTIGAILLVYVFFVRRPV